jgi:hypothetical protein
MSGSDVVSAAKRARCGKTVLPPTMLSVPSATPMAPAPLSTVLREYIGWEWDIEGLLARIGMR